MINNRQAGRRRGRGGNNNGPRQGNPGRPDNGNRIDNRARGNAAQLLEKYKSLASDAQRQGDRVNTEYYLQFADHYFRVLSEQRGRFEEQQPRRQRDDFDFDGEEEFGGSEFGNEGEPVRAKEQWGEQGDAGSAPRYERDAPRSDRENGREGGRGDRDGNRAERDAPRADRDERPREAYRRDGGEPRNGRGDREWQDRDAPRAERDGNREPRRAQRGNGGEGQPLEVAGQRRAEPLAVNESLESRAEEVLAADRPLDPPAPRRRGRPRRDEINAAAAEPAAFEADRLPPSLTVAANDETPAEPKPRRRRARGPAEDTPTAAE